MDCSFEFHADMLIIAPMIILTYGECDDPKCCDNHFRVTLGWLLWTFEAWW